MAVTRAPGPRALLRQLGLPAKHSWGQNFLGDEVVLSRIAELAMLEPGTPCVELGPGLGHLTRELLATGARVVAVERDRDMVAALHAQALPGLTVVEANAVDVRFAEVGGAPEVVVVGNLPYHLSSPILFSVLDQVSAVSRAVFTLQAEVVDRLAAEVGSRESGVLTVLLNLSFTVEHCLDVPRDRFFPVPAVDSAVVRLIRRPAPLATVTSMQRFVRVVKAAFGQRRKTLTNALRTGFPDVDVPALLLRAGIDGTRRGETLSVAELASVERALDEA